MTQDTTGFIHRFEPGPDTARPLLLLHGTGGDENDLLPLGRMVAPEAALLAPRGGVSENGMPRFFLRLAEGVFDEADLRRRTGDLAAFVAASRARYGLGPPLALGFSNGANIAASLLMLRPETLTGAVLIRPMVPFAEPPAADLAGRPVLILSGAMDPIVPVENARRLAQQLSASGARVEHRILPAGHGLSQADVSQALAWLRSLPGPEAA
ncbi:MULTISPECIES: alpha/beta hydrolase [Methylobacterium]|uniref:Phospholipase/Carboxylesterase n=1 Tax=Methylobacterium oryzae CBMB20 TaxID=693986 RepID=A0A089P177_9HYPH|nr:MULTISPECIES: alpha/beta hydrolase [Methylobacterium]AIQ93377.1 Phospholipase/Carboxylesterase [Methylobacterium oryzae CBMB20]AWV15335.1 hydrolase [Methylobacterium sp. XJLW]KOX54282.1 hydrolase [Streptomyces purpurogeneiscleroticus]WFS07098.1 alpha/beta hydrolase [Methylobacterium sp. 391_Methyba4]